LRRALGVLAALPLLAVTGLGCDSLRAGAAPEVPLWYTHPGGALDILARRELTGETRVNGERYERGKPEIDPVHRRVFVGSSDNGLYALHAEDLTTAWRFETRGSVQSEPLYDRREDVVYFGSNDGALYKVRAADGGLLWRFNTAAEVSRRPVLDGKTLYLVNANDTLISIDASSGKLKWHQHRTPAFGMEVAGYAGAALGQDKVFTAFSDGVVMAYAQSDGAELWPSVDLAAEAEQSNGGEVPKYLDCDTTPIFDTIKAGPVVFVASYGAGVFALDAENGAHVWRNDKAIGATEMILWRQAAHPARDGAGPETPAKKLLVVASAATGLWGIDPQDGHTVWRRKLPEGGIGMPAVIEGALLVTSTRYGLFLFSPTDGALIDGIETGSGFAMSAAAFGRRAYVMSNGGQLLGIYVTPPPSIPFGVKAE
jgi:outer membrane protein assembly factor BamB